MAMSGRKKIPCLADATIEAFRPFPIDCSIILHMTIHALRGNTTIEYRKAAVPTVITSASPFRNNAMISGAKAKMTTATTVRNINAVLTQNQKASRTLLYFLAP